MLHIGEASDKVHLTSSTAAHGEQGPQEGTRGSPKGARTLSSRSTTAMASCWARKPSQFLGRPSFCHSPPSASCRLAFLWPALSAGWLTDVSPGAGHSALLPSHLVLATRPKRVAFNRRARLYVQKEPQTQKIEAIVRHKPHPTQTNEGTLGASGLSTRTIPKVSSQTLAHCEGHFPQHS